jgi:hypothetical protein
MWLVVHCVCVCVKIWEITVAADRDRWLAVLNILIDLRGSKKCVEFHGHLRNNWFLKIGGVPYTYLATE